MGQIGILASYKEITGQTADLEKLRQVIGRYRLDSLLACCCRLQMSLRTWENPPDYQAEDALLDRLLPGRISGKIRSMGGPQAASAFNRISLLFMIKQAIACSPADGRSVATQQEVEQIGLCFLMANDLVLGYVPKPTDTLLQNIAGLSPFGDLLPRGTFMEDVVRCQIIFATIIDRPPVKNHHLFQDLRTTFQTRCGISHQRFAALAFGASTRYTLPFSEEALFGEQLYLPRNFFAQTNATPAELAAFFELTASGVDDLRIRLQQTSRPTDFSPIQAFPLLSHADSTHLCLDPGFLMDKAGKGLFWILRSKLNDVDGKKLKTFWGAVYEEYLQWLWEINYLGAGRYFPGPHFTDGTAAFDACLLEGTTLTVFEYKASTLATVAKHSFDPGAFGDDLKRKYAVFGSKPKGVGQLQRGLQRLCNGDSIPQLDFSHIRKVFPVLVSVDEALVGPGVALYLDSDFRPYRRAMAKQTRKVFPPLFSVLVSDIEYALPYTGQVPFSAMLEQFSHSEPSRSGQLRTGIAKNLFDRSRGPDIIGQHFAGVEEELKALFNHLGPDAHAL